MRSSSVGPPGTFLDVGGHRLHVTCRGHGSPAVLLEAGIAASSLSWTFVQPEIAAFAHVCAYDRAGLAWSDVASCPRTFDEILRDLAQVVAHAEANRIILVGHSFGSLVVRGYAARAPERVAGLVLVDPPIEWITPGPEHARRLRGGKRLSRVGAVLARLGVVRVTLGMLTAGSPEGPRRIARLFGPTAARVLERLVGEVRKLPPDLYPVMQHLWSQPKCFHAMGDYLAVLEREGLDIARLTPAPEIPVIVISGAHQPADEIAAHRQLAEASHHGRHLIAPRSGHWIPFDQPDVIVSAVRDLVHATSSQAVNTAEPRQ